MKQPLFAILIATCCALGNGGNPTFAATFEALTSSQHNGSTRDWRYMIKLSAAKEPTLPDKQLHQLKMKDRLIYRVRTRVKGNTWYRLRLGFFNSRPQAEQALRKLKGVYPNAWIASVHPREKERLLTGEYRAWLMTPNGYQPLISGQSQPYRASTTVYSDAGYQLRKVASHTNAPAQTDIAPAPPPTAEAQRLQQLMQRARQAMVDQQYNRAIELYNNVLREAENEHSAQALEFMGLALERRGLNTRALRAYQQFLDKYPEHEGVPRVQQRRDALITAAAPPKQQLRARQQQKSPEWQFYGGVSQFYRRDENTTEIDDNEETAVTRSALTSDLYLTGRRRSDTWDMRTRFSGGYEADFLDGDENELRISTLYFDTQHLASGHTFRIGRQSESKGGLLGRFDGVTYGHYINDQVRINLVAGFPVETSTVETIDTDRYFYGINTDLGTFAESWDYNVFFIEQQNEGLLDRRAIGGEVRYFKENRTLFSLVDYDISYDQLNTFLLVGSWTTENERIYNLSFNYRNSPILTTNNAFISQGFDELGEFLATGISEDEARQLAEDRTAVSRSLTLGVVQPIDEQFQLSGDITISDFGSTPASGGVEATEGTDTEVSWFIQGIGSDLIKPGDIAILSFRYSDRTNSKRYNLSINTRYPVSEELRINPRLQLEYRTFDEDDTDQWIARPSFRADYRFTRRTRFEFELGGEWSSRELNDTTAETRSYFILFGYRYDF